jgi:hypothetical protein
MNKRQWGLREVAGAGSDHSNSLRLLCFLCPGLGWMIQEGQGQPTSIPKQHLHKESLMIPDSAGA